RVLVCLIAAHIITVATTLGGTFLRGTHVLCEKNQRPSTRAPQRLNHDDSV
uniref:Uncharacterized protein n=1 Tax=Anopheles albimanus TaxID=7167 RepID=A0A182FXW1_ANOAL